MTFTTDRDLLNYEPLLLTEITWPELTQVEVNDAATAGTTLTSATAGFIDHALQAGMVGVLGVATVIEVVSVDTASQLTVSKPRPSIDDALVAPGDGTAQLLTIRSFASLRQAVADEIVQRLIGGDSALEAEQIVVSEALRTVESLGVLATIYRLSAENLLSANPDNHRLKATYYSQQFKQQLNLLRVEFDLDGDGAADGFRDTGLIRSIRK